MEVKRIVVVRQLGGIGDVINLSCVFRGLRETYPDHIIQVITSKAYDNNSLIEIFQHVEDGFIDDIFVVEPEHCTTRRTRDKWYRGRKILLDLDDDPFYRSASIRIDLNTVCMEQEEQEMMTPSNVVTPRYKIWCDEAGVVPSSYLPSYVVTEEETKAAKDFLHQLTDGSTHKLVGVGVQAKALERSVTKEQVIDICYALKQKSNIIPVTLDSKETVDGILSITGKTVPEMVAIVNLLDAVITVDTGLLHMAGAVGTPLVGLFGSTDPAMRMDHYKGIAITSKAHCSPCWYRTPCKISRNPFFCMSNISTEEVVEAVCGII